VNALQASPQASPAGAFSVSFVPAAAKAKRNTLAGFQINQLPVLETIVRELGPSLAELARQIQKRGPASGGTSVLVTGCERGVGCTTVALALAWSAAEGNSVVLMDADLGDPEIANRLDFVPRCGWDEAVQGLCPLEQALYPLGACSGLGVLPLRRALAAPDEFLDTAAISEWIAALRRESKLIVLDGGAACDYGARWAPWVDTALVVSDTERSLTEDWARTWDRLEEAGAHVMGIVETFS
jgi:Mrp family chromosome partitioning ATPase